MRKAPEGAEPTERAKNRVYNKGKNFIRIVEECSEIVKIYCKMDRFGEHDFNPDEGEKNIDAFKREIGDLLGACVYAGFDIQTDDPELKTFINLKIQKINKWKEKELLP